MYITRNGPALRAYSSPRKKRKRHTMGMCLAKPLPDEVSLGWIRDSLETAAMNTTGVDNFKWEYQLSELLSKLPESTVPAEVRRDAAIDKMLVTESKCRSINIDGFASGFGYSVERFNTIANLAKTVVLSILGPTPDYNLFSKARFSGGASTSRKRAFGHSYYKYNTQGKPVHVTKEAYPYARALIENTPLWYGSGCKLQIVPGNRITTVPKKTEIDRTIAMEPDMNMSLQLAVGHEIRARLRKAGINLNDQNINQRLAKVGSKDASLATIDLSSASDSISHRIVRELLPTDWFTLLDDLRSPIGQLPDGGYIAWEKFSSMGNGYTFELETLLFYAIVVASVAYDERVSTTKVKLRCMLNKHNFHIYGDDIIVPTVYAHSVIMSLREFGFETNLDKTFVTGLFRESCGKHYYGGTDVTPFYIRRPIDTVQRIVWLLNSLRRWSYVEWAQQCDPSVYDLWRSIRKRYCPARLLGGKDVYSTASVASPGKVKDRLISVTRTKFIDGMYAYLSASQGRPEKTTGRIYVCPGLYSVDWARLDASYLVPAKSKANLLAIPMPGQYWFTSNDQLWRPIILFSQEIR